MNKEELIKYYYNKVIENLDCGDSSCYFSKPKTRGGQHTNGGCRCLYELKQELRLPMRGLLLALRENT